MSRGVPASLSGLKVPARQLRTAATTACPECHEVVPTRDGRIAGHYAAGREICSGSSSLVAKQEPASS